MSSLSAPPALPLPPPSAEVAVTPESALSKAPLLSHDDPLKIRGRVEDDDDCDFYEDSGLGFEDSSVGAETVSRIVDFFRQPNHSAGFLKDGKVLVPKTPVSHAAEDPLEACRNALRPLADLMAAKKDRVLQADNGRLNPTKKRPKRNPKKKIMTRKADKKEDVRESEDYVPSSEVDDDEYLPPGVKTWRKWAKKANQPKKAPRKPKPPPPSAQKLVRRGRPKKPKGQVEKCKYVMTKERQPRPARVIKAAVNAIAVQEAVQGCQTSRPAVAIESSAVEETRNPTGVKELVVKPLISQTLIIRRPFATDGELKTELVIHETYLSRLNPYSQHRVSTGKSKKVPSSASVSESAQPAGLNDEEVHDQ